MKLNNRPNLFIVGFQKCASSTLFDILTRHPDITGSNPKETFYLVDKDFNRFKEEANILNPHSSWDKYFSSPNKFLLEASVCNFYQKNAINYISKIPNVKVIFVLRDPVDRFKSVYKYLHGMIEGIPFEYTIDQFYREIKKGSFERPMLKYAIEHGRYHHYIKNWENTIPKENILLYGFKELIKDENLAKVYEFLNIDIPENNVQVNHTNKSLSWKYPKLTQQLHQYFGGSILVNKYSKRIYNASFKKVAPKVHLPSCIENELISIYKDEYKNYRELF